MGPPYVFSHFSDSTEITDEIMGCCRKGAYPMPMPKDEIQKKMADVWNTYVQALEKSLAMIDRDINEAK